MLIVIVCELTRNMPTVAYDFLIILAFRYLYAVTIVFTGPEVYY